MFSLVSQRLIIDVVFDNQKWRNAVTNINLNLDSNTIQVRTLLFIHIFKLLMLFSRWRLIKKSSVSWRHLGTFRQDDSFIVPEHILVKDASRKQQTYFLAFWQRRDDVIKFQILRADILRVQFERYLSLKLNNSGDDKLSFSVHVFLQLHMCLFPPMPFAEQIRKNLNGVPSG